MPQISGRAEFLQDIDTALEETACAYLLASDCEDEDVKTVEDFLNLPDNCAYTLVTLSAVRDFEQPQGKGATAGSKFNKIPPNKIQANITSAALVKEVVAEVLKLK